MFMYCRVASSNKHKPEPICVHYVPPNPMRNQKQNLNLVRIVLHFMLIYNERCNYKCLDQKYIRVRFS